MGSSCASYLDSASLSAQVYPEESLSSNGLFSIPDKAQPKSITASPNEEEEQTRRRRRKSSIIEIDGSIILINAEDELQSNNTSKILSQQQKHKKIMRPLALNSSTFYLYLSLVIVTSIWGWGYALYLMLDNRMSGPRDRSAFLLQWLLGALCPSLSASISFFVYIRRYLPSTNNPVQPYEEEQSHEPEEFLVSIS